MTRAQLATAARLALELPGEGDISLEGPSYQQPFCYLSWGGDLRGDGVHASHRWAISREGLDLKA